MAGTKHLVPRSVTVDLPHSFDCSKSYLSEPRVLEKLEESVERGGAGGGGGRGAAHTAMLDATCHLLAYLADLQMALKLADAK